MGLTIHYRGKLKSPELIEPICDELKDIAQTMNWEYAILDEDFNKANTSNFEKTERGLKITGHLPLKGISINIHNHCETFSFLFDKNGVLCELLQMVGQRQEKNKKPQFISVKTQFAPVDVHITIVKLLKYLQKKYFSNLDVIDEGEYWDTEDEKILIEKINFLSDKINKVSKILSDAHKELGSSISESELVIKIEKILKERLNQSKN